MCGICCIVFESEINNKLVKTKLGSVLEEPLIESLERRGPDFQGVKVIDILPQEEFQKQKLCIKAIGTVLHLRGKETPQPLQDSNKNILLWNGEVFSGGVQVPESKNDGEMLLDALERISAGTEPNQVEEKLLTVFNSIKGPWAFIYWQAERHQLWFGRDYFGRRSLLWHWPTQIVPYFALSSVASTQSLEWEEVPAKFLYRIDFKSIDVCVPEKECLEKHSLKEPWSSKMEIASRNSCLSNEAMNTEAVEPSGPCSCSEASVNLDNTFVINSEGYRQRSGSPLLFCEKDSGYHLSDTTAGELYSSIYCGDLSNQGSSLSSCRATSECQQDEVDDGGCKSPLTVVANTSSLEGNMAANLCLCNRSSTLRHCIMQNSIKTFLNKMLASVRRRVTSIPERDKFPRYWKFKDAELFVPSPSTTENSLEVVTNIMKKRLPRSRIGILFSGGIDSMFLAAIVDKCLPPNETIDLINVAFEKKQKPNPQGRKRNAFHKNSTTDVADYDVPDRLTGRAGLSELNRNRVWNFVQVDVSLVELQKYREERIKYVVYPSSTVLDDSIGCAIWFAARGYGNMFHLNDNGQLDLVQEGYMSPVKVLLTGIGADEQLGGYARHRSKFEQSGWTGLSEEMEMELNRISYRNLGRDDRCVSDHGREARFPFLDEDVVTYLQSLPVWIKCDPRLPRGIGEKRLLREAAKHLGLSSSALLPKRAIQFGSRIAKLESNNEKGNETCQRLR